MITLLDSWPIDCQYRAHKEDSSAGPPYDYARIVTRVAESVLNVTHRNTHTTHLIGCDRQLAHAHVTCVYGGQFNVVGPIKPRPIYRYQFTEDIHTGLFFVFCFFE